MTLAPQGADVAWGGIAWKAWKDLTCESMDFVAMEQVDVCAMFEEEVERLPMPTRRRGRTAVRPTTGTATDNLIGNDAGRLPAASFKDAADDNRHRFTAMWYLDDTTDATRRMFTPVPGPHP